ncbi:hypothetical protein N9M39_00060 [Halieaceae bacterium]|nr:hypothetical protein [Halieaceae bacterium]
MTVLNTAPPSGERRRLVPRLVLLLCVTLPAASALADTATARCDVYPLGQDHTDNSAPCSFSQRQGYISITRADGVRHDLSPEGDTPGNFRDQDGRPVYRQSGLGSAGQIFRFPTESVFVFWATMADETADSDNPTAPYSTADFDATTLLPCRADAAAEMGTCPAGILRMEGGASIVVMSPAGEEFTINFARDYVNATNREVEAEFRDDWWHLIVNGREEYRVPRAAIEGG